MGPFRSQFAFSQGRDSFADFTAVASRGAADSFLSQDIGYYSGGTVTRSEPKVSKPFKGETGGDKDKDTEGGGTGGNGRDE